MQVHLEKIRYVHHKTSFYKQFHTHNICEMAYYISGVGTVVQNETRYEYSKGTIHLVKDGISHDENNQTESKIMLLYFEMPEDFVPSGVYFDRDGTVLSLMRQLRFEMQENLMYRQEMIDAILMQILLKLKRKLFPHPAENKDFNNIIRYIDENFQFDIDVHKIASQSCYSYDRFRHLFKEHTGIAPQDYINNKRVDLARFLIDIDPGISLTAIKNECGYKSLSQFSNAFRAKVKISPTEYKIKAAKKQ